MRKFKRNLSFSIPIDPALTDFAEYNSLGQRIRDAIDQGVSPDVQTQQLMFDDEHSGDVVDPLADPRTDPFEASQHLEALQEKMEINK